MVDTVTAGPALLPAGDVLPEAVRRARRRARKRARRAGRARPGQERETALHETRKAVKDARYAAEAARPAVGKKARRISTTPPMSSAASCSPRSG